MTRQINCVEVNLGKRPRYLNPFAGRKKRIHLSGLFLFDPDVALRINGRSMRTMFGEMGKESLFKGLERVSRTGRCTQRLKDELLELMPMPIQGEFRAALDGEKSASDRLSKIGPWEAFSLGACEQPGKLSTGSAQLQFLCRIERASRRGTELCMEGRFIEASDLLADDELMANFLTPANFVQIAEVQKIEDLLPMRVAVAIEVWLSVLALLDIQSRPADASDDGSHLAKLIPRHDDAVKNTVALFFDSLLSTGQVRSIGAFLRDARLSSVEMDLSTIGAWSRGKNFPRLPYIEAISEALLCTEDAEAYVLLYSFARHLNFLGYLVQELERLDELRVAGVESHSARFTFVPFGYDTFESWLRGRYPFWLKFHRARLYETL